MMRVIRYHQYSRTAMGHFHQTATYGNSQRSLGTWCQTAFGETDTQGWIEYLQTANLQCTVSCIDNLYFSLGLVLLAKGWQHNAVRRQLKHGQMTGLLTDECRIKGG